MDGYRVTSVMGQTEIETDPYLYGTEPMDMSTVAALIFLPSASAQRSLQRHE